MRNRPGVRTNSDWAVFLGLCTATTAAVELRLHRLCLRESIIKHRVDEMPTFAGQTGVLFTRRHGAGVAGASLAFVAPRPGAWRIMGREGRWNSSGIDGARHEAHCPLS
jgi:hypothetical protein